MAAIIKRKRNQGDIMNISEATRCKSCHNKQEMLDYELTIVPIIIDGAYIGETQKQTCCNISFYCAECKVSHSTLFPYYDPAVIETFIEDVKFHTVKFHKRVYE